MIGVAKDGCPIYEDEFGLAWFGCWPVHSEGEWIDDDGNAMIKNDFDIFAESGYDVELLRGHDGSPIVEEKLVTEQKFYDVERLTEDDILVLEGKNVETKEEVRDNPEDIKRRARKPPSDGPCKGCGKNLPLNRLMLCYKCWLKKKLIDEGKASGKEWIPGDPHPLSEGKCGCNLPEHFGGPRE